MKNRTPAPAEGSQPLPDFTPVPRRCARHDGWTPARQRAFIEALADTGSVSRAAAQVNMSSEGAYYLRRQPGADQFRAAWSAALDFGVARMKDIAFERAVEGTLVSVITGGRLIGYRRIYNDRLLMFCLRHYGEDANGRRTRVEYFSTRATAGAASAPRASQTTAQADALAWSRDASPDRPATGAAESFDVTDSLRGVPSMCQAEASTTTVRTTISGGPEDAVAQLENSTALIENFTGLPLDEAAQAAIATALQECAARRREAAGGPDDPRELFFAAEQPLKSTLIYDEGYKKPRREMRRALPAGDNIVQPDAFLLPTAAPPEIEDPFRGGDGEMRWEMLDDEDGMAAIEAAVAEVAEFNVNDAQRRLTLNAEPTEAGQPAPHRGDRTDVTDSLRDGSLPVEPKPSHPGEAPTKPRTPSQTTRNNRKPKP